MKSILITLIAATIFFSFFKIGESSLYLNKIDNMQVRSKRQLSVGATGHLAHRLYKEGLQNQKEPVTKNYRDPKDPYSYGKK
uniref:Uncharacterized protein n=1 Tax=Strongyloides stercoralis TaxID=6248 RepID=A0A0K0E5Y8_STRER